LLAPFYLLGGKDLSIIYAAWLVGTIAHAALALETARVAERLAGRAAAVGAALLCLGFGAFAWFAWSGMETVPFAWMLMRTVRVASEWCEHDANPRPDASRKRAIELAALGFLAPLLRPEGAVASLIAATALAARPARPRAAARLFGAAPLVGILVLPALHWTLSGHAASSTATVKWMVGNPYFGGAALLPATLSNVRVLVTDVLDGGDWTSVFLPEGASIAFALGLVALGIAAARRGLGYRAIFILAVVLATFVPCTYLSFLWNRLRYVWPFAGAWFVLLACLAREIGDGAQRAAPSATFVTPLIMGCFVGAVASRLPWAIRDLTQSASAIDRQQVALARWAASALPAGARIGVNDTGAIAYLSGRETFDVVGLTTEGEARYWAAGAGSRFEHYERLSRDRLPTHFIVYSHWMACAPVLGAVLTEVTVVDQSILGGATMTAYEARYDRLGSGALPSDAPSGELVDEVDVADLESEQAHAYDLEASWERDDQVVLVGDVADGGRLARQRDRLVAHLHDGKDAHMVMRLGAESTVNVFVRAGGKEIGSVVIPGAAWTELDLVLPAGVVTSRTPVEIVTRGDPFDSFHYWFYQ
jgi:hypothetical protein